jgi:hypothetical protein
MTREEFIRILDRKGYSYRIDGDNLIINQEGGVKIGNYPNSNLSIPSNIVFQNMGNVDMRYVKEVKEGVIFNNNGDVDLTYTHTLSPGVKFNNVGYVYLNSLSELPPDVEFNNGTHINLESVKILPTYVRFNNGGRINLRSIIGGFSHNIFSDIDLMGIRDSSLINSMIKQGVFI